MSLRHVSMLVFALLSAAMLGLAGGAVWVVLALYSGHAMPWLVLPLAALLAWVIRAGVRQPGKGAATLAALATLLAAIYVKLLVAALELAASMGVGLTDAMHTAGLDMLWHLAWLAMTPADLAWAGLGMVLAGWLAWRRRRPERA